jgi:competence protein ComEC
LEIQLLAQRGHLFCWVPVCLGIGIGGYFSLRFEPDVMIFLGLGCLLVLGLILSRLVRVSFAPLIVGLVLIGAGAGIAKFRTDTVSSPVLGFRYYGPIEGRVVNIDRSGSDAMRLTLDRVILNRMSPDRTPSKVRVSVHGDGQSAPFRPGDAIMTTGHLSPPSGPAEPGGFDFQRHAWFLQIGAVGYTRNPIVRIAVADGYDRWRLWIFQQRRTLAKAVRDQIGGEPGAFAAAIMTGDRSAMSQATIADLRATNLAHLLAISGLHMGLLTGFVFAVVRMGLALIPALALRYATKKFAAVVALVIGAGYLALSGGNVATERAYIMVAVMLVAVLLDRRALTLRAVAMAATLVLILQPEALVGPGFQMSFAATTALVLVFGGMRHVDMSQLPKWVRIVFSVVLSSAVAGVATAPFAAIHFNQIADFGLLANILSVPLMGIIVMPAAVLAVCLAPLGLWSVGLWFVDQGLQWILFVAGKVANIEDGVGHVMSPSAAVLPILGLSLIWVALWQGRGRLVGGVGVICALFIWSQTTRPAVLVADNGALIGLMGADGRILSRAKGGGFVAGVWLENDGAPIAQMDAAAKGGFNRQGRQIAFNLGDWHMIAVTGKTALAALTGCGGADILISNQTVQSKRPCRVIDVISLRKTGALAFDLSADGDLITTTARQVAGQRPWAPRPRQAPPENRDTAQE